MNILIPGTIKSFGVLLVEFNSVFQTSAAASSGIVALCYFLYSSLGECMSRSQPIDWLISKLKILKNG